MLCVYRFKLIVLSVLLRTKIKNRDYITPYYINAYVEGKLDWMTKTCIVGTATRQKYLSH